MRGMKAALSLAVILAARSAAAQPPSTTGIKFAPAPRPHHHGGVFFPFFFPVAQREVVHEVVEREVVREVPAKPATPPAPPPREPYVIGHSYTSLPAGCMKMVEGGARFFRCSGEWYQELGKGQYKAVAAPL